MIIIIIMKEGQMMKCDVMSLSSDVILINQQP